MSLEALLGQPRRGDVFDRAALRFALNARPAASQGEAPAGAIENMRILKSKQKEQYKVGFGPPDRRNYSGLKPKLETAFTQ
jgi:hypothetical protein